MATHGYDQEDEGHHDDVYLSFLPLAHIYGRWALLHYV